MPSVCLILKVHEPHRLRPYSFFDIGEATAYGDEVEMLAHLEKNASQCYLPATRMLLKQILECRGDFRFSILLSGVAIDQFERFQPELLDQFRRLADTGCVEFICEPYFHSFAFLFSKPDFREQMELLRQKIKLLFGQIPTSFHHHALSYNDDIAIEANVFGIKVILASGTDRILESRSISRLYQPAPCPAQRLLFENPLLADNIARFSPISESSKLPLTSPQFMSHLIQKQGEVMTFPVNLNVFGKQPLGETEAFVFLSQFPSALQAYKGFKFETPSEAVLTHPACGSISSPGFTTWEDAERDSNGWICNEMQKDAIHGLYLLEKEVKSHANPNMLLTWRQLQVSDHFLFMDTTAHNRLKESASPSPYNSPYDAYINFMNILTDFSERLATR